MTSPGPMPDPFLAMAKTKVDIATGAKEEVYDTEVKTIGRRHLEHFSLGNKHKWA
jgi:hypothetical protein